MALAEYLRSVWKRLSGRRDQPAAGGLRRRDVLALLGGAGLGWIWRRTGLRSAKAALPVRPPGSAPDPLVQGLCARCGNCMRACPEGIIVPDLGSGGAGSWLTPRLDFSRRYCNEWCRACTAVCPTGALARLTLDDKREWALGKARVDPGRCLAWAHGEYCTVCHEFCSYQAIRIVEHNGVNCPEVDESLCRGCGACQCNCPVIPDRAIVVEARAQGPITGPAKAAKVHEAKTN